MGFSKLKYTRDWRNEDDFHAVVTDETQVRADQQALFEEVKEHVNKVADELDAEKQRVDETMATKEALRDLATTGVADGAVTPEKLSPETLNRSYTKDETWTAATKAGYGLEADAVPDAALSALAPLLHNWWAKKKAPEYKEVQYGSEETWVVGSKRGDAVLYYASSYVFDTATGEYRLLSPTAFDVNTASHTPVKDKSVDLNGKFVAVSSEGNKRVFKFTDSTSWRSEYVNATSVEYALFAIGCKVFTATKDASPSEFEHRVEDGIEAAADFVARGSLLDWIATAPKMKVGSYTVEGADYAGETAPVEAPIGFDPDFLFIFQPGSDAWGAMFPKMCVGGSVAGSFGRVFQDVKTKDGVVSWRCDVTDAASRLARGTFYYFAIGL